MGTSNNTQQHHQPPQLLLQVRTLFVTMFWVSEGQGPDGCCAMNIVINCVYPSINQCTHALHTVTFDLLLPTTMQRGQNNRVEHHSTIVLLGMYRYHSLH